MQRPIVVGFDGSEHGLDALALGHALAALLSVRLVVVVAYTPEDWLWAPGTAEPLDQQGRERVLAQARDALSLAADVEIRMIACPSAAAALYAEVEHEQAQILVVGSPHVEGVRRLLLGTVTQQVLDAAPCAVGVAPAGLAGTRPIRLSTIGVGFDDTPEAHNALTVAAMLARSARAELRLIWAAHLVRRALPLSAFSYWKPDYFQAVRADVEDRLEQAAAAIRADVPVRADIVRGDTTGALAAQSERLDLLVLGSRGYGPIKRVLLGSVSRQLLEEARCSVLVVPRGARSLEAAREPTESERELQRT